VSKRGLCAALAALFLLCAASASAAVIAEYSFGGLSAESDGSDAIAVTCVGGQAKVNGADPDGGPAPCGEVTSIDLRGGPGPNALDLSGVAAAAFPAAETIVGIGDDGADTLTGSPLADELEGSAGDDTLRGGTGIDALTGGEGDDRIFGGAGDDLVYASSGSDTLDGQADSDRYELDLFELGPAVRVADTGADGVDEIELADCEGVTVEAGRISREAARITVSGIERYPCGFVAPPPPPPPATGPNRRCVVPRVRGRTLARAKVLLARANCRLGKVTRVRSRARKGVVLRQSPVAGARRARGAKVALRVSRGP
jgi:RTX calcium-binding nonapeptide repeat (4 copies)/PASTA domain